MNIHVTNTGSSAIKEIEYDSGGKDLTVRFPSGERYRYSDVPLMKVTDLIEANSMGRYFNREIKDVHQYERL